MNVTKKSSVLALVAVSAAGALGVSAASGERAAAISQVDAAPSVEPSTQLQQILTSPQVDPYAPDLESARSLSVGGSTWTVVDAADSGLCLQVETGAVTCTSGERIRAGQLALTRIDPPTGADAERLAAASRKADAEGKQVVNDPDLQWKPTPAVRRGIVADGIASARAVGADGATIASTEVKGNAYVLPLGLEGEARAVEFLDASGKVVTRVRPY